MSSSLQHRRGVDLSSGICDPSSGICGAKGIKHRASTVLCSLWGIMDNIFSFRWVCVCVRVSVLATHGFV